MTALQLTNAVAWIVVLIAATIVIYSLHRESEGRAVRRLLAPTCAVLVAWAMMVVVGSTIILGFILAVFVVMAVPVVWAVVRGYRFHHASGNVGVGRRSDRPDERDTMFARMAYAPNGAAYEDYYTRNPERRPVDDALRKLPQLCSEGTLTHDPLNSKPAPAIFDLLQGWHSLVDGPRAAEQIAVESDTDIERMTARIKGMARFYGALDVGITRFSPEFIYSHIGRREAEYGMEVNPAHRFAIVFTVEMDHRFIGAAPRLPVVVESSHQYLEAARTALALAANIRALGWEARAHMDGNYLAVLPPLAARAGLGEIGRMGLLVTEDYGPRVRLGLVSTNLPLKVDQPRPFGLGAFCRVCKKCAVNCPPQVISRDDEAPPAGWQIVHERCYKFWRISGTDCASCINVCPYSKPQSTVHRLVRLTIRDSQWARRAAVWMDDVLYGQRPISNWEPEWFQH